jgi:hypothetical protein
MTEMDIRWMMSRAVFLSLGFLLLFTSSVEGQPNTPTVRDTYFLNGDYVVFGKALKGTGQGGFATNNIVIPAGTVPDTATAVAAFLYWGTVVPSSDLQAGVTGAQFKGHDISDFTTVVNPMGSSPCWLSGGGMGFGSGRSFILHRADVLRFFETFNDPGNPSNPSNGKFILNTSHQVKLPDSA